MQFILTQSEYDALRGAATAAKAELKDNLQSLATALANSKPVHFWGRKELAVWGCILNEDADEPNMGYCDECPAQIHCPHTPKKWSK